VREYEAIDEFQIHLYTAEGIRDEIVVLIEVPDAGADAQRLVRELGAALSEAHEGLRFGVRSVELGSLPRFELKAKRLVDERVLAGSEGERKRM
jgi:phenylacetate-CoA ligase